MAAQDAKTDLINGAFSQLRISGITVIPSASDMTLALRRLESCMAELFARNIKLPYNFEETPDLNSPHNLERKYWDSVEVYLAYRLAPDFGKQITATLASRLKGAISTLFVLTASVTPTSYPSRMPRGKRNDMDQRYRRYFPLVSLAPNESETKTIYIDDVNTYIESFVQVLNAGEIIDSFTIEADDEITLGISFITDDTSIAYAVTATGPTDGQTVTAQVKIQITTDASRLITRIINFNLVNSEI